MDARDQELSIKKKVEFEEEGKKTDWAAKNQVLADNAKLAADKLHNDKKAKLDAR